MQNAASHARLNVDSALTAQLGDREFEFIRHVVEQNAGIILGPNKRQLVQGRLSRRLRELGLPNYEAYCEHVRESGPEELVGLINAITTNVTAFFREKHHFDALAQYMLPEAMKRNASTRRLRIWSAGCSSGEEPHSIAITALATVPSIPKWDLKILATDIDSDMVGFAKRGCYPQDRIASLSEAQLASGFIQRPGDDANVYINPQVASHIRFAPLNLMHDWPMKGPFDVIFCRNVMIYFDQATRERLVQRFASYLAPEGYLCLGHSESIYGPSTLFKLVGKTIYRRLGGGRGA